MKKKFKTKMDQVVELLMEDGDMLTNQDINNCFNELRGRLIQAMLEGEMNNHLGYEKYDKNENPNSRNGYSSKERKLKTQNGNVTISMPRDRKGTFEPVIINKRQRVLEDMDDAIITMYSKGMTQRDIVEIVKKTYGIDVSASFISEVVKAISCEVKKWQERELEKFYPFIYVDCLYTYIKNEQTFISEKFPVYVIIGIDIKGHKDILTTVIGDTNNEASYFWNTIFEDLKQRGVEDILFVSMDGLKGLESAINSVFPQTQIQRCIVHLTRNLYQKCPKKEAKEIISGFKKIYSCSNSEETLLELENFKTKFSKQDKIVKVVEEYMEYIMPLFELPKEIRKIIYTTNPIESVNSALRKVTNGKGSFPNKEAVLKVLYLRIRDLSKKWSKGIPNWDLVLNQLVLLYDNRVTKYIGL